MRKVTLVAFMALALGSCNPNPKFDVKEDTSGIDGKVLYLETSELEGVVPLGSVELRGDGSFSSEQLRPESLGLYRLRAEDKVINSSIDSTGTISIRASYTGFLTAYAVEDSGDSAKIRKPTLKQIRLQKNVGALIKVVQASQLGNDVFEDSLTVLLKSYKDDMKINYVFAVPSTTSTYFALFQRLDSYMIFDPLNNKDDIKCFGAVTTSLNNTYPYVVRSRNLYNIVIRGIKNTRTPQRRAIEIPGEKIAETGMIDIALRGMRGNIRKLTNLKDKAILLDSMVCQSVILIPHNLMLRDLYNRYADQGLEIYQISLDVSGHFQKTLADNLPWVYIRDENEVYSTNAALYGIRSLSALFLTNRNSELRARGETMRNLEETVESML